MASRYLAIILKQIKYGEKNLILQTYTREEGSKAFFAPTRSKKKTRTALHGLAVVEIESSRGKGKLENIREISQAISLIHCLEDMQRSSILMFLNEVLNKCISDYQADQELFNLILHSLVELEEGGDDPDFHLRFLNRLSMHLGFFPNGKCSTETPFFDLIEGEFCREKPLHAHMLEGDEARTFSALVHQSGQAEVKLNNSQRRSMLSHLLDYYRIHIENFNEVKSREVLETVLS